jgi:catechol 2,3-dioxygenase-like lactoylglutathione lyase family enzyme
MLNNRLSYVTIACVDADRTANVLEKHFELARSEHKSEAGRVIPMFAVGETAVGVVPVGDPFVDGDPRPGVHHVAFESADPVASAAQAAAQLRCSPGGAEAGLGGTTRIALPSEATEGVKAYFAAPLKGSASSQIGLIERIDHLGIVSGEIGGAIEVFHRRLGLALESQQIDVETHLPVESFTSDKYGAVYHNRRPIFCGGVRSAFITAGDCEFEFLQDYSPLGPGQIDQNEAGTTRQDRGAIARFLARRGPGLAHIALKTPDIDKALAAADAAGCELIDRIGRPGGRRSQIAFLHPRGMGGVLFHFVERE